jgi:hypothetical protein
MTPTDPKKAEEVALFRTYLTSKLAADMWEWWYVHWAMDEDDTNAAALELALILKLNQGGLPGRFLDRCPIFTDLFKSLWRSIRHHSQRTESMFNLIDNTNLNAKGMSWERLVARVLAKAHYTRVWQAERRAAHVRKISPVDEDEQKGKISKKPRLQNNAAACRMAARQVVALKDTYTSSLMNGPHNIASAVVSQSARCQAPATQEACQGEPICRRTRQTQGTLGWARQGSECTLPAHGRCSQGRFQEEEGGTAAGTQEGRDGRKSFCLEQR